MNVYLFIVCAAVFVILCSEAAHLVVTIRDRRRARRAYRLAVAGMRAIQLGTLRGRVQ